MKNLLDQKKTKLALEAGRDYPKIYREFVEWFPNDDACKVYLEKLHWPNGFIYPACNSNSEPWKRTRERLVCPICKYSTINILTFYLSFSSSSVLHKQLRSLLCARLCALNIIKNPAQNC